MENNKRPIQAKLALEYMKEHGSITSLEGILELGIISLPKRICELEKMGYLIKRNTEVVVDRYGKKTQYYKQFIDATRNHCRRLLSPDPLAKMYRNRCRAEIFRNIKRIAFATLSVKKNNLLNRPLHLRSILHIAAIETDSLYSYRPFEIVFGEIAIFHRLVAKLYRIIEFTLQHQIAIRAFRFQYPVFDSVNQSLNLCRTFTLISVIQLPPVL
jgi:hypothetical protein